MVLATGKLRLYLSESYCGRRDLDTRAWELNLLIRYLQHPIDIEITDISFLIVRFQIHRSWLQRQFSSCL